MRSLVIPLVLIACTSCSTSERVAAWPQPDVTVEPLSGGLSLTLTVLTQVDTKEWEVWTSLPEHRFNEVYLPWDCIVLQASSTPPGKWTLISIRPNQRYTPIFDIVRSKPGAGTRNDITYFYHFALTDP